jgi:hypothetical protein
LREGAVEALDPEETRLKLSLLLLLLGLAETEDSLLILGLSGVYWGLRSVELVLGIAIAGEVCCGYPNPGGGLGSVRSFR